MGESFTYGLTIMHVHVVQCVLATVILFICDSSTTPGKAF